eukprot:gene7681-5386_t
MPYSASTVTTLNPQQGTFGVVLERALPTVGSKASETKSFPSLFSNAIVVSEVFIDSIQDEVQRNANKLNSTITFISISICVCKYELRRAITPIRSNRWGDNTVYLFMLRESIHFWGATHLSLLSFLAYKRNVLTE